ncbi:MAG: polyprenol monophosphomannose synthase [Actinomycetota bacterium]
MAAPSISIIVPTFNEADNILELIDRLDAALAGSSYEIIVVDDDSADGTWRIVEERATSHPRLIVIRRRNERGLSSAVLAGMAASRGRTLVTIDADLQHDESRIPDLVAAVTEDGADLCLGSREAEGGGYGSWRRRRRLASWVGARLARLTLRVPVSDPMSGFFAISRDRYETVGPLVNPRGFKIMLEFLARGPRPAVSEVGYQFGPRLHGTTKLTGLVVWHYLRALASLVRARRRAVPVPPVEGRSASAK